MNACEYCEHVPRVHENLSQRNLIVSNIVKRNPLAGIPIETIKGIRVDVGTWVVKKFLSEYRRYISKSPLSTRRHKGLSPTVCYQYAMSVLQYSKWFYESNVVVEVEYITSAVLASVKNIKDFLEFKLGQKAGRRGEKTRQVIVDGNFEEEPVESQKGIFFCFCFFSSFNQENNLLFFFLGTKTISVNRVYNICCALKIFVEFHLSEVEKVIDFELHPDYVAVGNLLRNLSRDKAQESKLYCMSTNFSCAIF